MRGKERATKINLHNWTDFSLSTSAFFSEKLLIFFIFLFLLTLVWPQAYKESDLFCLLLFPCSTCIIECMVVYTVCMYPVPFFSNMQSKIHLLFVRSFTIWGGNHVAKVSGLKEMLKISGSAPKVSMYIYSVALRLNKTFIL